MKENKELERNDIAIDRDMEVDYDIGQEIMVYIETWFDVDKKFGTQLNGNDSAWLNLYGKYNPYEDTLRIECEIDADDGQPNQWFDYEPTEGEAKLIKEMIAETMQREYNQTPREFCESAFGGEPVYLYENRGRLSAEQIVEKHKRLRAYCEGHGYEPEGSLSISVPMGRCGVELENMTGYCKSRGITRILVDRLQDIGKTDDEISRTAGALCAHGFEVEVAGSGQVFSTANEDALPEEQERQGLTMGGI